MPYLTPNAPGSTVGRILYVPNTYLPSVNGALYELAQSWNWEQFGTETVDNAVDAMLAMWEDYSVSNTDDFDSVGSPITLQMWAYSFAVNPPVWASNTSQGYGGNWQNATPAQNDLVELVFWSRKAAYTLEILGITRNANGITTAFIDGVSKGTSDWYSSVATLNVKKSISLGNLTRGSHTLQLKMATKNASSTGYRYDLSSLILRLT
jgi:hypothetical protein